MSTFTGVTIGRWIPVVVMLLSVLMIAPDVAAQSRQRGRTTRAKTSDRGGKGTKAKREGRKKQTTKSEQRTRKTEPVRSRTKTRTPEAKPSRRRAETRNRSTQTSRTQSRKRSRQPQTSRDKKTETRSRSVRTSRDKTRTRTRAPQTDRETSKARSSRRGGQAEQDRGSVRDRGRTRGNRDTKTQRQRSRTDDVEVTRGRSTRTETRGKTRQPRQRDVKRGSRDTATRAPRQSSSTNKRRAARPSTRRDVDRQRRVRYVERDRWQTRYERDRRYNRKHYKRRYHKKKRSYYKPRLRPFIHIDIRWPWEHRYRHGWRPRYQYRQVIYVNAGWGGHRRQSQIDVRTSYYHELRHASDNKAEVDIYIERVEFYENGRYLGEVHDIPKQLGRIRATVYRNGHVTFDRNVFIVGDSYAGFEMISTRYYDGFLLDTYRPSHGMRVGVVDLHRGRIASSSYSRLFDLNHFDGYVPVSLLPDDRSWLLDYGNASYSANYYDQDPYYYGGYSDYDDAYDDPYYGDDYYEEDYYVDEQQRPHYSVRSTVAEANFDVASLTKVHDRSYQTAFGANIQLKRETEFVRVK